MIATTLSTGLLGQYDDVYFNPDTDYTYNTYENKASDYTPMEVNYDNPAYAYNDPYDFYYTSRIQRFYRPGNNFGFYSPAYVDLNYYDPSFAGSNPGYNTWIYDSPARAAARQTTGFVTANRYTNNYYGNGWNTNAGFGFGTSVGFGGSPFYGGRGGFGGYGIGSPGFAYGSPGFGSAYYCPPGYFGSTGSIANREVNSVNYSAQRARNSTRTAQNRYRSTRDINDANPYISTRSSSSRANSSSNSRSRRIFSNSSRTRTNTSYRNSNRSRTSFNSSRSSNTTRSYTPSTNRSSSSGASRSGSSRSRSRGGK